MKRKLIQIGTTIATAAILIVGGFALGTATGNSTADSTKAAEPQPIALNVAAPQQAINDVAANQDDDDDAQRTINVVDTTRVELYERVAPSVVAINVSRPNGMTPDDVEGAGSGFVIDTEGHIVTNYHVVRQANEITVTFFNGTITRADTVGLDPDSDLAVIKVDVPSERLVPVTFGDASSVQIGQSVVAIGNPFRRDWTLTSGIISAKNRTIRGLGSYSIGSALQTDAPINPGNSGGPLLNLQGEVIGVNSQIISSTGSNSGVGFAVPSDLVQRVARELIEDGEVNYSFVGIQGGDITLDFIEDLNLPNDQQGVFVSAVLDGGPAEDAGLREPQITERGDDPQINSADIIVGIDGEPLNNMASLISYLARFTRPGDTVQLEVLRDGEVITLPLTLDDRSST